MASDAAAPNVSNAMRSEERCITPGGLAAARPSRGQRLLLNTLLFVALPPKLRRWGGLGSGPAERCAVDPHAVHEHGQFPGDGNLRLLQAIPFGEPKAPRPERGPLLDACQQRAGSLKEVRTDKAVPALRDAPVLIDLAGLVAARREAEVRSDAARIGELGRVVDRRDKCESCQHADAWDGHQPPANSVPTRARHQLAIKVTDLLLEATVDGQQGADRAIHHAVVIAACFTEGPADRS